MGFKIKKSIIYNMMNGSRVEYEFDNTKDFDYITFKGGGKESFSFNVILVKQLIETFEIMLQDIYSDNYKIRRGIPSGFSRLNMMNIQYRIF